MISKGDRLGSGGDAPGLWDGNPVKLDCDDHCITINVINSLSNNNDNKGTHLSHEYTYSCHPSLLQAQTIFNSISFINDNTQNSLSNFSIQSQRCHSGEFYQLPGNQELTLTEHSH